MTTEYHQANAYLHRLLTEHDLGEIRQRLTVKPGQSDRKIPRDPAISDESVQKRWQVLQLDENQKQLLLDPLTAAHMSVYEHNIENFIGTVKVPVGIAGPLRVNGVYAQGDYILPLATSEAALVASYNRGANLITAAGGCSAALLNEGVSRAPGFAFRDIADAGQFVAWALTQFDRFKQTAATTTRFGELEDMRINVEANHVYLIFQYRTGDAAGQNMVTIATQKIFELILRASPVAPQYAFLEANMSGDKKASVQSFLSVRGKKVSTEVRLSADLVRAVLHTTPARMVDYWRMSALGGVQSGTIGVQGHYANGLAALYIACGQDAACVSESAIGVTRMEVMDDGALYASVTLPNLIVGTVGGGTKLPSQQVCLQLMGLCGASHAQAFAEVCASVCLAGELSIIGALCAGHFAGAHQHLARGGSNV